MKATIALALAGFAWLSPAAPAQTNTPRLLDPNAHSWWVYYGDHPVRKDSKFGLFTELQIRRADFATNWQQFLLREAVTYKLNQKVQFGVGYGFLKTSRYGSFPVARTFREHRLFEQVILKQEVGRLELDHRYRVEQRWLETFSGSRHFWRNQDRFRYQLKGVLPVSTANNEGQQWYLFAGDEVFLGLGTNYGSGRFDQNRLFAGVGYKLSRNNKLEVGYLHQFIVQRSGLVEESNHTFRVQFSSTATLFGLR